MDSFTDEKSRGGLQQIFNLVFVGVSGLLGNFLAGFIAESFKRGDLIDYKVFWAVPSLLSLFGMFLIILLMRKSSTP